MHGLEMRTGASISSRSVHGQGLALPLRRTSGAQTARLSQNSRHREFYCQLQAILSRRMRHKSFLLWCKLIERCTCRWHGASAVPVTLSLF